MKKSTGIAVIEVKYWEYSNISYRSMFDLISEIICGNPHGYYYEMANSEAAMSEAVPRNASNPNVRFLCLAMHGDENNLEMLNGEKFSRTRLRNALSKSADSRDNTLEGLYVSCCFFLTSKTADFLFQDNLNVVWVAGYGLSADWIEASALDLLFFNALANTKRSTPERTIAAVARRLVETAPGLIERLGFGIFVRDAAQLGARNLCEVAWGDGQS